MGAVVAVKTDRTCSNDERNPDGIHFGPNPKKGSKGIVIGFHENGDRAVKVVFLDDIEDANGEFVFEKSRDGDLLSIPFHANELELIALATFVDGRPCRSCEFEKTHMSKKCEDASSGAMFVISNGSLIEITAYDIENGEPWYVDAKECSDISILDDFKPIVYEGAPGPSI